MLRNYSRSMSILHKNSAERTYGAQDKRDSDSMQRVAFRRLLYLNLLMSSGEHRNERFACMHFDITLL